MRKFQPVHDGAFPYMAILRLLDPRSIDRLKVTQLTKQNRIQKELIKIPKIKVPTKRPKGGTLNKKKRDCHILLETYT